MTDHVFLVYCHKEIEQAARQCLLLRRFFSDNSTNLVYYDGPSPGKAERILGRNLAAVGSFQPDKCRGIVTGLNALIALAEGARIASFLHPDMVPTDREHWRLFLRRFAGSKKAVGAAPMWPKHYGVSFCAFHFALPKASGWFPAELREEPKLDHKGWFNEYQLAQHLDRVDPRWKDDCYHLSLLTMPYKDMVRTPQGPVDKQLHRWGAEYVVNDFCPETSVVHTND